MKITIKPKTFGPLTVDSTSAGEISIATNAGLPMPSASAASATAAAPSDQLLAALGSCIAISMRAAAGGMKLDLGQVALSVTATKATDLPSRFGRFDIGVRIENELDPETVGQLLTRTKDYCTVSNTLSADIVFNID